MSKIIYLVLLSLFLCAKLMLSDDSESQPGEPAHSIPKQNGPPCSDEPGTYAVQRPDKDIESQGCNSIIKIDGSEDFTYCCDRKDACYSTCGASVQYCDKDYTTCMQLMCKREYPSNGGCLNAANMLGMAGNMFGNSGYDKAQSENCICVENDIDVITEHYTKLVGDFYGKYAPDKVYDARDIVDDAKYTSNSGSFDKPSYKFHELYYKLLKKYDSAIKHIGARVGKDIVVPRRIHDKEL